jgi:predicted kinase
MSSPKGPPPETDVSRILNSIPGNPPAASDDAPALILAIGLPGSGKSPFCRRLAPTIDAALLESDALRELLFETPAYTRSENHRLFTALYAVARRLIQDARIVIVDATNLTHADRKPAYELADQTGAMLLQLRFTAQRSVVEKRLRNRSATPDPADHSSADLEVYRHMATREETPKREYWNIDTSDAAETEAALSRVVEVCRPRTAGGVLGGVR